MKKKLYFFSLFFIFVYPINLFEKYNLDKFSFFSGLGSAFGCSVCLFSLYKLTRSLLEKKTKNDLTSELINNELIEENDQRILLPSSFFSEISFESVHVNESLKNDLLNHARVVLFSKNNNEYFFPNFICLFGLSGTGKTSLMKGIANKLGVPIVILDERLLDNNSYQLLSIDSILDYVKKLGPCIVHIKNVETMSKGFFVSLAKYLKLGLLKTINPILFTFSTGNEAFLNDFKINKNHYTKLYIIEKPKQEERKKIIDCLMKKYKNFVSFENDISVSELAFLFEGCTHEDIYLILEQVIDTALLSVIKNNTDSELPDDTVFNEKIILPVITKKNIYDNYKLYKKQESLIQGSIVRNNTGLNKVDDMVVEHPTISFADIIGLEHIKREVEFIVKFLKDPKMYKDLGIRLPKGFLFSGPPGCGKTLMAQAIAGEANVTMVVISASEILHKYVGEGAAKIRSIFEVARAYAPTIIFIDEIDAIGSKRSGEEGGEQEKNRALNELLTQIAGFNKNEDSEIIVIGATNRADVLDEALTRSGRLEKQYSFPLPTKIERNLILKYYLKNITIANDLSIDEIAARTSGFSGADLEFLVNETKLISFMEHKKTENKNIIINNDHFHQSYTNFTIGLEMNNINIDENQLLKTAYHEAGHTLCILLQEDYPFSFDTVTIVPRDTGDGSVVLGFARSYSIADLKSLSKEDLKKMIITSLGGMMAEELILKDTFDGVSSDLAHASRIAELMVKKLGMEGSSLFSSNEEMTKEERDLVEGILQECKLVCKQLLTDNLPKLVNIAKKLLTKNTLTKDEVLDIIRS